MDTSTEQPSSMLHVRASTMYPLPTGTDDDVAIDAGSGAGGALGPTGGPEPLPFPLLCGEARVHSGRCVDGTLAITNYRLYLQNGDRQSHVPLGLIELVEVRDMFYLHIWCKDARSYRCTFDNNEQCGEWFRRLTQATAPPRQLADLFAFCFHAWASEREHEDVMQRLGGGDHQVNGYSDDISPSDSGGFRYEVERLGFDLHGAWRISHVNTAYRLCSSYPPQLLVPACISDDTLETVARFRSSRRIPAVVWRHAGNGAVIARCSQPEVGWLGWRSSEDEDLLKAIADACAFDKGPRSIVDMGGGASAPHTPTDQASVSSDGDLVSTVPQERPIDSAALQAGKKVLIMDARSYTTAVANRARGGGCECPEYYPSCDIQFMNLANIHSIRKSFHALRQLCSSSADQPNWWSLLEGTRWLQHMSGLMRAAATLAAAVERDARPVLVHCSDGWDRTPQIVALAELLLDPYYRTMDGFRLLVEREWLAFGHKFADRCGHAPGADDPNERCPVFLQWLDCVHQLLVQFPCSFQFANTYLVKLAQHTYSNLFGTFLCNTKQDRVEHVQDKTFSVWVYLNSPTFKNHLYAPGSSSITNQVVWPACNVRDLQLWSDVYIGALETSSVGGGVGVGVERRTIQTSTGSGVGDTGDSSSPGGACCAPNGAPGACSTGNGGAPICGAAAAAAMTKTRSYGDLMGAAGPCAFVRRSSDPSITIDTMKLSINSLEIIPSGTQDKPEEESPQLNIIKMSDLQNGFSEEFSNPGESIPNGITPVHKEHIGPENGFVVNGDFYSTRLEEENGDSRISLKKSGATDVVVVGFHNKHNGLSKDFQLTDNFSEFENEFNELNKKELVLNNFERFRAKTGLGLDLGLDLGLGLADINHNGEVNCGGGGGGGEQVKCADDDSDNERSESKSEVTLCPSPNVGVGVAPVCPSAKSNDTSTDTLVPENGNSSVDVPDGSQDVEVPVQNQTQNQNGASDGCEVCAQNRKLIEDKHMHFHHSRSTSGKNSRYSTPPPYSRTPSAGGSGVPPSCYLAAAAAHGLDLDGLIPLRSDVQHRLWLIQEEHRIKEEALQRELHTTRMALIKQVCHNCSHNDPDRPDDTCGSVDDDRDGDGSSENNSRVHSPCNFREHYLISERRRLGSVVGSVCSTGEGQASVGDSLPSDLSWEALDEGPALGSGTLDGAHAPGAGGAAPGGGSRTLWVPDHAVSRCTGCHTEFWLGRRKHHCRNCGRIFCADCSENSTPLPNEQLYNPVRVCTSCYVALRRGCSNSNSNSNSNGAPDVPDKCKHGGAHTHPQPHGANAQLTATSN